MPDLEQKTIPAQQVISILHQGTYDEIGSVYRLLRKWADERGVKVVGRGLTVFHDPPSELDQASARYEVCLPVVGEVHGEGGVAVKTLPQATVVYIIHRGPYAQIPARYTEILAWIDAQGYEISGPPREVYLRRPRGRAADSTDCVTEIQFPVNLQ